MVYFAGGQAKEGRLVLKADAVQGQVGCFDLSEHPPRRNDCKSSWVARPARGQGGFRIAQFWESKKGELRSLLGWSTSSRCCCRDALDVERVPLDVGAVDVVGIDVGVEANELLAGFI